MGRRTIGTRWPVSAGWDDYPARCDICGVPQLRSLLRYDTRGMAVCPIHGSGADSAELSLQNAAGAQAWAAERATAPVRDLPTHTEGWQHPELGGYHDLDDPSLPPKLLLDLDPSDTSRRTLSGGSVLSLVNPVSGAAFAAPSAPTRPTLQTAWLNGNDAIVSDGTQYLLGACPIVKQALEGSDRPFYALAVMTLPAGDSDVVFGVADENSTTRFCEVGFSSTAQPRMQRRGISDAGTSATATGSVNASPHIVEWDYNGTHLRCRVDGAANDPDGASCDTTPLSMTRSALFCRPASTPTEILAATVGRLLVYSWHNGPVREYMDETLAAYLRAEQELRFGL
jgi:hypothetical protein